MSTRPAASPCAPADWPALIAGFMTGQDVHVTMASGVYLHLQHTVPRPGLSLEIQSNALQSNQLREVLEKRYEHPLLFNFYYVFLDSADHSLVIWNELKTQSLDIETLNATIQRALTLANLQALAINL